jgi:hypothetical protein
MVYTPNFTVYINGIPFYSVFFTNVISYLSADLVDGTKNMAFRKPSSGLGVHDTPFFRSRTTSCLGGVLEMLAGSPVGARPGSCVLDMWAEKMSVLQCLDHIYILSNLSSILQTSVQHHCLGDYQSLPQDAQP